MSDGEWVMLTSWDAYISDTLSSGYNTYSPSHYYGISTSFPTSFLMHDSTMVDEETGKRSACFDDMRLLNQDGGTFFNEFRRSIQIVHQDVSTVTVDLEQHWSTSFFVDEGAAIDSIFYSFKEGLFSQKCYEEPNVRNNGMAFDTITISCNLLTPVAYLEICVADDSGFVNLEDRAVIPKCCHSQLSAEVPTVCYFVEIQCESLCTNDGDNDGMLDRKLRGSETGVTSE
ncbi:unnamed protein product [Pseudo-nitzschia multistriata]|uniref:DUF7633 domain-containing protein n=1 Tax=Pseudo-nitzschia multistriata TaxID=183589 RepID=A0A448YZ92_9STRA|nr:unnamed protein product [Pseudo-nitzschia multistriata]